MTRSTASTFLLLFTAFLVLAAAGQEPVPDAPSATRPPEFPGATPRPQAPRPQPSDDQQPQDGPQPAESEEKPAQPPPAADIRTVPAGQATADEGSGRDQIPTFRANVSFVVVPVTVKDRSGRLVDGLLRKDFSIYENGEPQKVQVFTSDPFPLSAAVILDSNMSDTTLQKVAQTYASLIGAFSQFDEVSYYTFGNVVSRVLDFTASLEQFERALKSTKTQGRRGVPLAGGPMTAGPTVSGRPFDPSVGSVHTRTPPRESHVLNDAILAAAIELGKRDRNRRKIIFVISEGREEGSRASYDDVLKVLLSQEVTVYALGVGGAALPGYGDLQKIRIPGLGHGNILPKYASATGGEVLTELNPETIEKAYARVTEMARNQYTLGYTTRATTAGNYRSIEVLVHRPSLLVFAKDGYYPLPPRP